jgi:hypothetical protein
MAAKKVADAIAVAWTFAIAVLPIQKLDAIDSLNGCKPDEAAKLG